MLMTREREKERDYGDYRFRGYRASERPLSAREKERGGEREILFVVIRNPRLSGLFYEFPETRMHN